MEVITKERPKKTSLKAPSRAASSDNGPRSWSRHRSAASSVREVRDSLTRTRFGIRLVDPL